MWKGIYIYIYLMPQCLCCWVFVVSCETIYIYIYNMPKCLWYSAHAILLRCDPLWFYVIFSIHDDLEGPWETLKSFLSMMPLRHFEGPWKTLRDHERHWCFFWHSEGPWETLRDVERLWGTLRDWFFLKVWGTLSVLERPWGTWETVRDLRDLEEVWETVWTNFSETLRELEKEFLKNNLRNLEGTWETVRYNWKNYIWGKPLSNGSVERFWYIFGRLQFAGSKSPKHSESWEWFCPHLLGWEKFHSHMYVCIYIYICINYVCMYIYIYI